MPVNRRTPEHGAGQARSEIARRGGAGGSHRDLGQPLVVAVDGDQGLLGMLDGELARQGLRVLPVAKPERLEEIIEALRPDIVVLGQSLPGTNGLELMRRIKRGRRLPVVLLGDHERVEERVRGLELGADDYVTKPFNVAELGSRIRAILRRWRQPLQPVLHAGSLEIDLVRGLVLRDGCLVRLTATEWHVLRYLAENPGRVVDAEELLGKVWGPGYAGQVHHLRVWVSRLRHKLEDNPSQPRVIRTIAGIGYMLQPDGDDKRIPA